MNFRIKEWKVIRHQFNKKRIILVSILAAAGNTYLLANIINLKQTISNAMLPSWQLHLGHRPQIMKYITNLLFCFKK